jgi:deazaflavin-dependent oxidoreductase (nitroreductase family)
MTPRVATSMPLQGTYAPHPADWAQGQIDTILETGTTDGVEIQGRPVVLLTMRGAKSGKLYRIPLMRVEHDGSYAAVASKGGAPKHPVWYWNLKANPQIELQDGTQKGDYVARELSGEEREAWWKRGVEAYPDYADYQTKTDRQIPVFVLEPATA